MIYTPFEETDTRDSSNLLSDASVLNDDFARMRFESASSKKEVTNDDVDLQVWNERESESDVKFQ
jgi:hypothetical protein